MALSAHNGGWDFRFEKFSSRIRGAASVTMALAEAEGAEMVISVYVGKLRLALPVHSQIDEFTKEQKDLASKE